MISKVKENLLSILSYSLTLIALAFIGYFFILTQNLIFVEFIIMIVFSLFFPVYRVNSQSKFAYVLQFCAICIGLLLSILFWCFNFNLNVEIITGIIIDMILITIVFFVHFFTRELVVIDGFELSQITRNSGGILSTLALGINLFFSVASSKLELTINNVMIVVIIISLYAIASSSGLNQEYRKIKLNGNLKVKNYSNEIKLLENKIAQKFNENPEGTKFLIYLLNRMTQSFILGDYERCFIDAYSSIFDETVVKPKDYREKIISERDWDEYRITRAVLVHANIWEYDSSGKKVMKPLSEKEILKKKKNLFNECLEIQKIVINVVPLFVNNN